ncbi:MAG TPA: glycosyltransferase family 4 protein [Candidatus Fimivivens sp.]|nr:glycosyltransferase family 4 protein [Candidatus Fimivivens sp.]
MDNRDAIIFSNYDDLGNPYYGGGGAFVIHETAKRLARHADVTVITGTYPGAKNETVDSVRYERIGFAFLGPKLGQVAFTLWLPFVSMGKRFDVWYESLTPPCSFSILPVVARGPVVGVVHMLSGLDMFRKYKIPFHWFERLGLRLYRRFIVLSEATARQVESANGTARIDVIPNGVEPRAAVTPRTEDGHVLFLGRIEIDQKGLDLLLEAWNILRKETSCRLVIAGSGVEHEERRLRSLVAERGLSDSVDLIGRVNGETKDALFREARFVVVPSRFETFSLVALEAFSYGLPIVCFDLENLSWIPASCAIKVTPFDVALFADVMRTLLADKARRARMGAVAAEFSKAYDWDTIALRYAAHVKNIIPTL